MPVQATPVTQSYRTTDTLVRGVIAALAATVDTEPFIRAANVTLNALLVCMDGANSDELLVEIETWLAAHYASLANPETRLQSESTGRASASYSGQTAMGLDATMWGQTAKRLDTTGCLAQLDKTKHRVGGAWLGRRPSAQTPYHQRS